MASSGSSHSPHLPHLSHVGLDRHIQEQLDDNEIITKQEQTSDISKEKDANNTKIISIESKRDQALSTSGGSGRCGGRGSR